MESGSRRLAALLLTDIVGYVSLTEQDERLALRLLEEHGRTVRSIVRDHSGRVVKTIGDAFLVEFDSALDAVLGAIELQRALHDAEKARPESAIRVRAGVHVGDVVHREGDVFGDAVNIVSRITPLALPGGICLTEPVYEQVRNRIDYPCHLLGLPPLKHVEFPRSVYSIELPWLAEGGLGRAPWVDRRAEVELVEHAIARAVNGEPSSVVFAGEAGIGKTRLAEETIRRAREHGFRVLRGRFDGDLAAPYSAWSASLRDFEAEAPTQLLYRVLGNYSAEFARFVPEVVDRVGSVPAPVSGPPGQGQRRMYDGILHFLGALSQDAPVLLFLDDLHNADTDSLHLFRYVVRSLRKQRLLVLGAYRDTEADEDSPLRQTLADLVREHAISSVRLDRLGVEEVRGIIEGLAPDRERGAEFVTAVFERSGGNPYFVEELLRSLREQRTGPRAGVGPTVAEMPWPDTVRRVLRQRLLRLPTESLRPLEIAALLGPSFEFEVLRRVSETTEEALVDALDGALRARILTEQRADHGAPRYAFTDRQTRDLLARDLSVVRARRYHRLAGQTLEEVYGPRAGDHADELAYHFLEGDVPEKALEYSLRAGERAVAVFAREAAIRHFRTALDLLDPREGAKTAPLLERLAEQELLQGKMEACRRHFDESALRFEETGERADAARVWLRSANIQRWAFYDRPGATERMRRAETNLEGSPETVQSVELYTALAGESANEFDFPTARTQLERALAVAERFGSRHDILLIRSNLLSMASASDAEATRQELLDRVEPEVVAEGDPAHLRSFYSLVADFELEVLGDSTAAVRHLERCIRYLKERGAVAAATDVSGQDLAATLLVRGELREARRLAEECHTYALENYPTPDAPNLAVLGDIARIEGDLLRSRELLERALELMMRTALGGMAFWIDSFLLRLDVDQAEYLRAEERAERLVSRIRGREVPPLLASTVSRVLELGIHAALEREHETAAVGFLEMLQPIAHDLGRDTALAYLWRAEGHLARFRTERPRAVERLAKSADAFRRLGWRYEEYATQEQLGRLCEELGDSEQCRAAIERANSLRAEMGLGPVRSPSTAAGTVGTTTAT